jgi:ribosomal protein S18 acetylase RimI-like enzyme
MVRLATLEDAESIAAIHVHAWHTAYKGILPAQFLAALSIPERTNMWRTIISEHHGVVLLASVRDGEVGFISFGPSRDEDGQGNAEIYAIYVLPQFWHQGLGGELLAEALRRLEAQHFIAFTLWVLEENAQARQFYEARGFRLDGGRREETIGGSLLREVRYEKGYCSQNGSTPVESSAQAQVRRGPGYRIRQSQGSMV